MLDSKVQDKLKKEIRTINTLPTIEERTNKMCEIKDKLRMDFNDLLDELFEVVNIKKSRIHLTEN